MRHSVTRLLSVCCGRDIVNSVLRFISCDIVSWLFIVSYQNTFIRGR